MSIQYNVEKITTAETLLLRQKVLKPFLPADQCINPGDDDLTTFHLGLSHEGKLITIATFLSEPHVAFPAGNPYRLRGMATHPQYWGQGLGQILLQVGIAELKQRRSDLVWCNARQRAFHFYEKMGFYYYGDLFELKDIGPHKVMYKYLISR